MVSWPLRISLECEAVYSTHSFVVLSLKATKSITMSGSGGFYKYRLCKHFYTHNCDKWVWVNLRACTGCLVSQEFFGFQGVQC